MRGVQPIPVSPAEGYALWAATWDATPSPIVALEERLLAPRLSGLRARRVIDAGCGTGRWTARLRAIGFDLSFAMLELASRKPGLKGRLAVADAAALPVASGAADLVICTLTLGHLRDQRAAMREFARILEPGGTLIVTDFHPQAAARGWRRTFRHGGRVYELENHPYTLEGLATPDLVLRHSAEAVIGELERAFFEAAGRPELFDAARGIPAVQLSQWTRA